MAYQLLSRRCRRCIGIVASCLALTTPALAQSEPRHNHHGRMRRRATASRQWRQEDFPNPETNAMACGGSSGRVCDPDGILLASERDVVEAFLTKPQYSHQKDLCAANINYGTSTISSNKNEENTEQSNPEGNTSDKGTEIQMAVALVKKMDLSLFASDGGQLEERAVETFARHVHDDWGVGLVADCGGAGVLIFLSIEDRAMYISRGPALEQHLTDFRLDRVMDKMKSSLRADQYHDAILSALEEIVRLLQQGPPSSREVWMNNLVQYGIPMAWLSFVACIIVFGLRKQQKDRQEYARVQSQLNEIDRSRAEALQGRYRAESCPICLECFEKNDDNIPIKGSDGQPLKLLRCGHVFDESCWAEWVNSGRSNVYKCPICNQDVGSTSNNIPQSRSVGDNNRSDTPAFQDDNDNAATGDNDQTTNHNHQDDYRSQRIMRQYQRERNFRLARLGRRYPRYIQPQMLQRWTESTYDGTLVRDPTFVQNDPARARPVSGSGSRSRGGGGFGGGSSGGGRAGRW